MKPFIAIFLIIWLMPWKALANEAWWKYCAGPEWTDYCQALRKDGWPEPKERVRIEYVTKTQTEEAIEALEKEQ